MKPSDIINYWFSEPMQKHWFSSTPAIDQAIKNKFENTWINTARGEHDEWVNDPEGCLALAIILDQFPLNMYRGEARSFETEQKAIEVTLLAISKNFDKQLVKERLPFLLIPLMHSENIENQNLSVKLFKAHQLIHNMEFAEHHREIIKKFGRFPHRNIILGRESTKLEIEYLSSRKAFKG